MEIRKIAPADAAGLLASFDLTLPENAQLTLGAMDGGRLVGTGSLVGDMLQGLAVARDQQGAGVLASLVTELVKAAAARDIFELIVITKPEAAAMIEGLGFRLVASAEPYAAMLAFGGAMDRELSRLRREADGKPQPRAAIVMNCNPFTLGHRYLIERACAESGWVFVLVVEEDRSEFPFADRIRLVRRGTAHLKNLSVVPGGRFAVSATTFPSYFTKQENMAAAETALDAALFADALAPALGVTRRYVGTEPLSPVTNVYNDALKARLPRAGIELRELPRAEIGGEPVSASRVRALLETRDWEGVQALVPETTYAYLRGRFHGDA